MSAGAGVLYGAIGVLVTLTLFRLGDIALREVERRRWSIERRRLQQLGRASRHPGVRS